MMTKFSFRAPRDVKAMVPKGESVVAWGSIRDGFVVASDRALYGVPGLDRIPWDRVVRSSWDDPTVDMVVQPDPAAESFPIRLTLVEHGSLPVVIRERVTSTIIIQDRITFGRDGGARVVARRDSDSGEIRWSVVLDGGLDAGDPQVRAAADAALSDLRDSLGI